MDIKETQKKGLARELLGWFIYLVLLVVAVNLLTTYVGQRVRVEGSSMEQTLHDGDALILNKISYRFNDPERFDIIVFPFQRDESDKYIKRIIALPGETVQIDEKGTIYINGKVLEENYGAEVIEDPGVAASPITLGSDEYFVMGDNRNWSSDSRTEEVGLIKRDKILGKAFMRIWPLKSFKILKHQ